jgi:hypothetical protein
MAIKYPATMPGAPPMAPPLQQQLLDTVAVISGNTTGAQTVIAAITGKQIFVSRIYFVVAGATNVTFNDGAVTDASIALAANQGFVLDTQANGNPWFQTAAGSGFQITTSSAVQIGGRAYYTAS